MTSLPPVGLDTETALIAPELLAPPLACVSYADWGQADGVAPTHDGLAERLVGDVLDSGRPIVGLNIAYDMAVLGSEYPDLLVDIFRAYDESRIIDVGLSQRLIDCAHGTLKERARRGGEYSLAGLSARLLGIEVEKDDSPRLQYGRLRGKPLSAYADNEIKYAIGDARLPLQLLEVQRKIEADWALDHDGPPLLGPAGMRARYAFALQLASCWGVRSSGERCTELTAHLDAVLAEGAALLQATQETYPDFKNRTRKGVKYEESIQVTAPILSAKGKRNTKAAKVRMERVMRARGLEPKLTDKGAISLDADCTLASGDPVLQAYSRHTSANTLRSRVEDLSYGAAMALQPSFEPLVDTGRTSCRKPSLPLRGFQLQNMPQLEGARETLEPRAGYVFGGADFTAAEMHTLAQVILDAFGESTLADTLNSGKDPHVLFGAALAGLTYEAADALPHKEKKALRSSAKPGNFGIPGGLGAATFVGYAAGYGVYLTLEEAQHHITVFKRTYPDIARYLQAISAAVRAGRDTLHLPRSGHWRGGMGYSAMANTHFQTLCAYAALDALSEVQRVAYTVRDSPLFGARVWGFVHDEILAEFPLARARVGCEEMARIMAERFNRWVPDVPTAAEPALFWRWSKGTETVRDDRGILQVSDPQNANGRSLDV